MLSEWRRRARPGYTPCTDSVRCGLVGLPGGFRFRIGPMCRVRLALELLRGLLVGLGGVALLTGWGFFLLDPRWAAGLLFAGVASFLLGTLVVRTRWCLDDHRICLGRRCYPLAAVEGVYAFFWRPLGVLTPRLRAVLLIEGRRVAVPDDLEDRRGFFRQMADRFSVRGDPQAVRAFRLWLDRPEVFRPIEEPLARLIYNLVLVGLLLGRHYTLLVLLVLVVFWEVEWGARRVFRRLEEALG